MTAWEAVAVAVVLIVAQELVARRRVAGPAPEAAEEPDRRARVVAIAGAAGVSLVLACGLVVASTASADTEWDVWAFWLPKAKSIYYLDGLQDGPDGITTFASAEYPPLAAVVDAVTFRFAGVHPADLLLQRWLLLAGFFLALAGLLLRRARPALVWPPLAMLAAAPATVRYADSLLADPLVAVTIALAAVCGVLWLLDPSRAFALLTALFLAAAALVKTEGFLLGILLAVLLLAFGLSTRRVGDLVAIVLAPVAALLPWKLWLETHDAPLWSELYDFGDLFRPGYLLDRLDRLGYALEHMARSVLSVDLWLLSVPIALLGVVLALPRRPACRPARGGLDPDRVRRTGERVLDQPAARRVLRRHVGAACPDVDRRRLRRVDAAAARGGAGAGAYDGRSRRKRISASSRNPRPSRIGRDIAPARVTTVGVPRAAASAWRNATSAR